MLTNIRLPFYYTDKIMTKKIITTMVQPRLGYAAMVWSLHMKKNKEKLESIQRKAAKTVLEVKDNL